MKRLKTISITILSTCVFVCAFNPTMGHGDEEDGHTHDTDSTKVETKVSGFIDAYYAYDLTNQSSTTSRLPFIYNFNRNNSLSINLATLKLEAESDQFHANITGQFGDYVTDNVGGEPTELRNLFEAYGGFKWGQVWIDAGIFGSNIGFESAISTENLTLTRSMVAENSPYYLSGVRATYQPNDKWTFVAVLSNGWQNMLDVNGHKAFGTQVTYEPSEHVLINHSTFIGDENLSGSTDWRIFNDVYTVLTFGKVTAIGCVDYGIQGSSSWLGLAGLMQYKMGEKTSLGLRGEYFDDPDGIVSSYGATGFSGFNVTGASINFDCQATKNTVWRLEGRTFMSPDNVYSDNNGNATNMNVALITSLAFKF